MSTSLNGDELEKWLLDRNVAPSRCHSWIPWSWVPIVDRLIDRLNAIAPGLWTLGQVKEKFGGLRFYVDTAEGLTKAQHLAVNHAVDDAEAEAADVEANRIAIQHKEWP